MVIAGYYCASFFKKNGQGLRTFGFYVVNRAIRIIPSYALFLCMYLTFGLYLQNAVGNHFFLSKGYILSFLTFTTNLKLSTGPGTGVALEGFFSIAIAAQLYLLIGLMLSLLKSRKTVVLFLLTMELSAIFFRYSYQEENYWFAYFFTLSRMDAFVFGAALAILDGYKKYKYLLRSNKDKLLLVSIILFIALFALTGGLPPSSIKANQFTYPILSIILALVVHHSLCSRSPDLIAKISNFGKLSYNVYLLKLPLIYFVYRIILINFQEMRPALVVILLLIASISINYAASALWYYIIDRPARECCVKLFKQKQSS
jgi:peptidoglycan/LPS O-acetylase OafA/YrhL